jgi:multicomponent Na+:H+ antiporter subunit B
MPRKIISAVLIAVTAAAMYAALQSIPFGKDKPNTARHYVENGVEETGAANIVTSVVANYRSFDTLGEVTVLFIAALGLGGVLFSRGGKIKNNEMDSSFILSAGGKLIFPVILLVGIYIFTHGHLSPGGGFQGGAVIASGLLLIRLGFPKKRISSKKSRVLETASGWVFVLTGLAGLFAGGYFLLNFLPAGEPNTLFSAGIIPVIYAAVGMKVGAELAGILDELFGAAG